MSNPDSGGTSVREKPPVVKQLYRLSVEPRVVDQLSKLAARTGEPKTRLATRLFTEAVMGFKSPLPAGKRAREGGVIRHQRR
jgi:hypothetical protein